MQHTGVEVALPGFSPSAQFEHREPLRYHMLDVRSLQLHPGSAQPTPAPVPSVQIVENSATMVAIPTVSCVGFVKFEIPPPNPVDRCEGLPQQSLRGIRRRAAERAHIIVFDSLNRAAICRSSTGTIERHLANVEQPQNSFPAFLPRLATLRTIGASHLGHDNARSPSETRLTLPDDMENPL